MVNQKIAQNSLKLAILGAGREGKSLINYIQKKWGKNASITVLDKNRKLPSIEKIKGITYQLGETYLSRLSQFDIVFRSPGVYYFTPEIQKARRAGVIITSPTKTFFDEIAVYKKQHKKLAPKIIGVTGTKGKGTVSTLIYRILKAAGKRVLLAGNIGLPMLAELEKAKKMDYIVLELSSFQLQDLETSPDIAVVLDLTPDHLEVHKNFAEYEQAKASIAAYQKKGDITFYFPGNNSSEKIARQSKGKKIIVSRTSSAYFKPNELSLLGSHNFANANIAAQVAAAIGCSKAVIRKAALPFTGNPHRLELIRTLKVSGSTISFYNDSAATNPEATAAAVLSFSIPTVLIAGGKTKGYDYPPLAKALKRSTAKAVILFGENKMKIKKEITFAQVPTALSPNLSHALSRAYHTARLIAAEHKNVAVILSPASASFDMFKDYQDRGNQFKMAVKKLR